MSLSKPAIGLPTIVLAFALTWCVLAAPADAQTGEGEATSTLELGAPARPINRRAPTYPNAELARGIQGWVELSFVVDVDGRVVDPVVMDSSGSRDFERAALRTVVDWEYEPATWNGEPVQQCETKILINFQIEGAESAVSQVFQSRYRRIDKALDAGDAAKAEQIIAATRARPNLNLAEMAWLSALETRAAGLTGDREAQLQAVRNATRGSGSWIDDELYTSLLYVRTALELEQGNYAESLSAFERLSEIDPDSEYIDLLAPHVETVRTAIGSDIVLRVPAAIDDGAECLDCNTRWHHDPVRRSFTLADVQGELDNIEFRCTRRRVVDEADEGLTWQLPESYGSCSIVVSGRPGATFSLLELPEA